MEWRRITVHAWTYVMCSSLSNVILYRASVLCLEVRLVCVNLISFGIISTSNKQIPWIHFQHYQRNLLELVQNAILFNILSNFPIQFPNIPYCFPPKYLLHTSAKHYRHVPVAFTVQWHNICILFCRVEMTGATSPLHKQPTSFNLKALKRT